LFCVSSKPRKIIAVGQIQNQNTIQQNDTWAKYGNTLGAHTEEEWRQQAGSVLQNSLANYNGEILAIELNDFRFFPEPVDFDKVDVANTNFQLMKEAGEAATTLLMSIFQPDPDFQLAQEFDLDPNGITFKEGKEKMHQHLIKERSRQLVNLAKKTWHEFSKGKLQCEVCSFSFSEFYGEAGHGFIEAHHKVPIATLDANTVVQIADLAPVCSNCHSILHRRRPLLAIEQLREIVTKHKIKKL
jgi:predicted HNH restriction endonuclease